MDEALNDAHAHANELCTADAQNKAGASKKLAKCALCSSSAEIHFWETKSFEISSKTSLCSKCADSKLPETTNDNRRRKKTTSGEIAIDLMRIAIIEKSDQALIFLREIGGSRNFAIVTREQDANLLIDALLGLKRKRPTVHSAWVSAFAALKSRIVRIYICDLHDHMFHARLHVSGRNCESDIDIMPIDALLLAVWAKAAIFIPDDVLSLAEASTRG